MGAGGGSCDASTETPFLLSKSGVTDFILFASALIIGGGILVSPSGLFTILWIFLLFFTLVPRVIARLLALSGLSIARRFSRKPKLAHQTHELELSDELEGYELGDDSELVELEQRNPPKTRI